jgi:hypothetical protein
MNLYRLFTQTLAVLMIAGIIAIFWVDEIHHPLGLAVFTGAGCLLGLLIGDKDPNCQRISAQSFAELIVRVTVVSFLVTIFYFMAFALYAQDFPLPVSVVNLLETLQTVSVDNWLGTLQIPLYLFGFLFPSFFLPAIRGRRVTI